MIFCLIKSNQNWINFLATNISQINDSISIRVLSEKTIEKKSKLFALPMISYFYANNAEYECSQNAYVKFEQRMIFE